MCTMCVMHVNEPNAHNVKRRGLLGVSIESRHLVNNYMYMVLCKGIGLVLQAPQYLTGNTLNVDAP